MSLAVRSMLLLSSLAFACAGAGCATSPASGSGTSPPPAGTTGGDGGSSGSAAVVHETTDGTCNDLAAPNGTASVAFGTGAPAAPAGGTIEDGLYVEQSDTIYHPAASDQAAPRAAGALVVSGDTMYLGGSGGHATHRFALSGVQLTWTLVCDSLNAAPAGTTFVYQFTAADGAITLFYQHPGEDRVSVTVYKKS